MKPHHLLTGLLVLAAALWGVVLFAVVEASKVNWPDPPAVAMVGMAFGQVTLATAWTAWGRGNLARAAGLMLTVVFGWHFPIARAMTGDYDVSSLWGGLLLLYALLNLFALLAARLAGLTLRLNDRSDLGSSLKKWWQFTVGGVLTLTTLAAMFLGIGRQVDFPWDRTAAAATFCLVAALGGAAAIISALWTRQAVQSIIGPLAIGGVTGLLLRYTGLPKPPYEALLLMALVQTGTIALAAAVLRVAGYRLERVSPRRHGLPSPK